MPSRHSISDEYLQFYKDRFNKWIPEETNCDIEIKETLILLNQFTNLATVFSCVGYGGEGHTKPNDDLQLLIAANNAGVTDLFNIYNKLKISISETELDTGFRLQLIMVMAGNCFTTFSKSGSTYPCWEIKYSFNHRLAKLKFIEFLNTVIKENIE